MSRPIDSLKAAEILSDRFSIPLYELVDVFAELPNYEAPKNKWIPIEVKEATPEEIRNGIPYLTLDCPIPADGEETLVTDSVRIWIDTWVYDDGWYLEDSDLDPLDITAWMPLPEPYKLEDET